jgi:hypothetical protein
MKHEAVNIRKEWDRLATYVLFIAYDLYSIRRQRKRRQEEEIIRQLQQIVASVRPERTDP